MPDSRAPDVLQDCHTPSIAFYMHDFSGGGVERMRLNLATGFRRRGWHVTIIVHQEHGKLRAHVPHDIDVISLGSTGTAANIVRLAHIIRRIGADIIVASLDHNNVAALLAARLSITPTRVFICQHNCLSQERQLGWKYRLIPLCYRVLSPLAAGIITVSDGVAEDVAASTGIARRRITTIYNPVIDTHPPSLAPTSPPTAAPHPWLANPTGPIFIFAGRLVPQKDPETLLRAFALLENAAARLIILGEGPLQTALIALAAQLWIADRIYFAGFQQNPMAWIARADALVLSSRYEGFANVIVEALACGTPAIATDCQSGPGEILDAGKYGTLVPVADAARLAAAMARHRKAHFPAAMLRNRAQAFTVDACVAGHIALFQHQAPSRRLIFGLHFAALRAPQVARRVLVTPPGTHAQLVVTPNADHVRLLRRPDFAAACATATLVCADGFPVALYAWLRGLGRIGRVTGCDILHCLMADPDLRRHRVFAVVESAATAHALHLWSRARGLTGRVMIAVAPPGLLHDVATQQNLAAAAAAFGATILLVTLGAPVSEVFVHRQRHTLPPCWALCVGQAVRVELGLAPRAPAMFRLLPLEWLWRLCQEPRRLAGRYLRAGLWFPCAVLLDMARRQPRAQAATPVA